MAHNSAEPGGNSKRWLLTLLVIVGVGVMIVWSSRPQPVSVETALVEQRELIVSVQEQGRTRAREPFTVAAPVSGQLLRTTLIEGDRVINGQIIASIAVAPENQRTEAVLRAALAAAEARVAAAQATLSEADIVLQRAQQESQRREQLFGSRMIGQEERDAYRQAADAAQVRLVAAEAGLAAARADVESARSQLIGYGGRGPEGEIPVLAPTDGYVHRVFEKSERVVAAGTPLFQISRGESMELVVDLLTQEAVQVSQGDRMLISGWGGAQTLEGRVHYIEPEAFTKFSALGVEEQRVNVIGELVGTNPGLGAEYRIEAAIVVWENPAVLTVPTSALFRRDESWHVFLVEAGTAVLRAVQTGQRSAEYAEVLQGLQAGDEVVVFPSDLVTDGVSVQ
ncbi:MAG: efflux RND transporter periplasmic adaptor subunit [Gammaproteobacteria bacterium]|nr:efflux RND transporter periplasmic adaptor subunit [Gammaproteobacteria bacterium]